MDGLCGCIFVPGAFPFHVSWPSFALELSTLSLVPVEEQPTPSNAEIRQMLHRLQLGLDKKGYGKMDEFKELDADIRVFLRDRQPMRQKVITEFF